eukprot:2773287-Rhodomonas_salina.1
MPLPCPRWGRRWRRRDTPRLGMLSRRESWVPYCQDLPFETAPHGLGMQCLADACPGLPVVQRTGRAVPGADVRQCPPPTRGYRASLVGGGESLEGLWKGRRPPEAL